MLRMLNHFRSGSLHSNPGHPSCSARCLRAFGVGRPISQARRRPLRPSRPAARPAYAAAADPPAAGSPGSGGELLDRAAMLATYLTDLFPAWVLGAVAWAAVQPAAFSWFHPAYSGQPALTVTLLAVGLQLTLNVSQLAL